MLAPALAPVVASVLASVLVSAACGGSDKRPVEPTPPAVAAITAPPPRTETEADREAKRTAEALALIPEGSTCLPAELRKLNAPRLQLAAVDSGAVVCALDVDRTRLLGPVACWNVEVKDSAHSGALTYRARAPLPGRGFAVMLDDRCARGYCLPKEAKAPADPVALIAWSSDLSKVAVLAAETVHLFDAATKAHEASFPILGDKGVASEPTAIHWNGKALFIEANDGASSPVWMFRPDGTAVGPLEPLGGKDKAPLSTRNGSFMLLNEERVAISEQGFSAVTVYEVESGKRTRLVRRLPASPCKKDELEALWRDGAAPATPKCKDHVAKTYAHLIGADAVAGSKNLLVLLRGPRLGELAVIDAKTLAERKSIKMPWCDTAGGAPAAEASAEPAAEPADRKAERAAPAAPAKKARPATKGAAATEAAGDPESGGE